MALPKSLIFLAVAASLLASSAATNHTVGGPKGTWDLRTDLGSWASSNTFRVGDNLVFDYDRKTHDVLEVTKANFDSCTTAGPIKTHNSGNDVVDLSSAGRRYFICGFPSHCDSGMKVQIDTAAAGGPSAPPSGSAPTPAGSPESSPGSGSSPEGPSGSTTPSAGRRLGFDGKLAAGVGVGMLLVMAL